MDVQEAVEYVAAIIVVVAAGVVLGYVLARRAKRGVAAPLQEERLRTYAELIEHMDGLRGADNNHKKHFINAYYRSLMHAPDTVVKSLNAYLQAMTLPEKNFDAAKLSQARDIAVLAMRRDAQSLAEDKTKLGVGDLYSIEINSVPHEDPAHKMKPDSKVDTEPVIAAAESKV